MKVLVTGAAGFIGSHLVTSLIQRGNDVMGIDNLNSYYDIELKRARWAAIQELPGTGAQEWVVGDIAHAGLMDECMKRFRPDVVIHLAAQAGVRHSLVAPEAYVDSNLIGFFNVLDAVRHHPVEHFIYASSSSVYGKQQRVPFAEADTAASPVSLYAATKRSNELMAHSYSHLFGIPSTGLRFFTVYGPWGRPDMAYYSFTKAILEGQEIKLFNHGKQRRDFTYVDDVVRAIIAVIPLAPTSHDGTEGVPYRLVNVGNSNPVTLEDFVATLERLLEAQARLTYVDAQPGDVPETFADTSRLQELVGFSPEWSLDAGLAEFTAWYRSYHGVPRTAQ